MELYLVYKWLKFQIWSRILELKYHKIHIYLIWSNLKRLPLYYDLFWERAFVDIILGTVTGKTKLFCKSKDFFPFKFPLLKFPFIPFKFLLPVRSGAAPEFSPQKRVSFFRNKTKLKNCCVLSSIKQVILPFYPP